MVSFAWYLSWNFYHMFIYQCKMLKLFLRIFRRFMRFIRNIFNMFFWPRILAARLWRSTGPVDRMPEPVDRSVDQRAQVCARLGRQWAGRPVGRPDQRALLSVSGRSTGRSTGLPNGHICDRWRSTGRSTANLSGWQISLTASLLEGPI